MELKSVRGKYSAGDVEKYIALMKKEYEEIASKQRERMMELRNENSRLKKGNADLEGKKAMLVSALIAAQRTSKEIVDQAKAQAEEITKDAKKQEQELLERIDRHAQMLSDLRGRCQNILTSIEGELAHLEQPRPRIYGIETYTKAK